MKRMKCVLFILWYPLQSGNSHGTFGEKKSEGQFPVPPPPFCCNCLDARTIALVNWSQPGMDWVKRNLDSINLWSAGMNRVYNVVSNWWSCRSFLLDLAGAVKCRLQIRFVPPCFVCLLTFAYMVWFSDDFFMCICWKHVRSQSISLLDVFFFWFIWHGWVPSQDVHSQTSSMISTATCVYQPVLIISCSRNDWGYVFHLLWLSMDFRDRKIQNGSKWNYFWIILVFFPTKGVFFQFAGSSQS